MFGNANIFLEMDNPIWHSLNSRHASFALGGSLARCYPETVTSLSGLVSETPQALAELAAVVPGKRALGLFLNQVPAELSQEWQLNHNDDLLQMLCTELKPGPNHDFQEMGLSDVPDMVQLTKLTQPGPFSTNTLTLGRYIGIRSASGQLLAMAGERLSTLSCTEISAVCTHPDFQGRGYAKALVSEIARFNINKGRAPFLHCRASNAPAIASYRSIGFAERRHFQVVVLVRQ